MAASPKSRVATTMGYSAEVRTAEAAKTARLRALRLAKEAENREIEKSALVVPAKPKPTRSQRASNSAALKKAADIG